MPRTTAASLVRAVGECHTGRLLILILLLSGVLLGALIGRWWALLAALALAASVALDFEGEVSPLYVAAIYGVPSGFGIAMGIAVRRELATDPLG